MMVSSKYIIITSINAPGEAMSGFCKWAGWQVVVVGDRKTPENWHYDGVTYLGIEKQFEEYGEFARAIPENTYLRKMMGYVYAIRRGATAIFESDDDNIPYPDAAKTIDGIIQAADRMDGERRRSSNNWLNAYELFGALKCWPRGFPLEFVKHSSGNAETGTDNKPWAIKQFLADEDPDVDAVYRMIDGQSVYFARARKFILDEGTYCPINSQATLWMPEAFPLLFLPTGVSDRVTDILRGYIASACLWKAGHAVAFASPVVFQKRNFHDLHKDFLQEMPLYVNSNTWCQCLLDIKESNMIDGYRSAIKKLSDLQAIPENNLSIYDMFLSAAGLTS
jgi:hypothetical protein